ncbi:MAG: histidine phosphatase family protein [Desulfobacterales bacterium]|nr:MAG: histidine phosphatase family protein [Desulfobacterales bacterium]
MPPASLITHFGIMRHAKTKWNQEKRIQGRYHSPLISEGKQQAREWGMRLKTYSWNRILASDAKRALETASLINDYLKIPLLSDSRLQEQDWGEWTGKTLDIIKKEVSTLLKTQERAGWGFCPPGGEDRYTVLQRSQKALQEAAEKWPGDKILVVTHKGVIKCLIYFLMGRQFLPEEPSILNSWSLHHIRFVHQRFQIEKINALAIS